ncbi:MAG: TolC family outer membrane protein, partial [Alphaproteobacteria bacterium]|nr:TolC family outer membrane protein [Alphaproteobacteria bacterium]
MLRYAYGHNPALNAARSEWQAKTESLAQARAHWLPSVTAGANVMKVDIEGTNFGTAKGSTSKMIELLLTQPLFRGGRTVAETDEAVQTILAQRAILEAAQQSLFADVATVYMDVLRDEALLSLNENNMLVLLRQLQAVRVRFDVGDVTKTDVVQAESRYARAKADHVQALATANASRARYERIIGQKPGTLGYPSVTFSVPDTLPEALAASERQNPSLLASRFLHRASKEGIGKTFGELLPELSFFAGWDRTYDPQPGLVPESTNKTIGVSASIPLYSGGAVRSRVREAKYTANQRYLESLDAGQNIREQTVADWEALAAARAEITAREVQVRAAETARKSVHAEMEVGARTVLDSLDADQEYLDARVELVRARRNEIVALFALSRTMGILTPDLLGFVDEDDQKRLMEAALEWKILGMDVD